MYHFFVEPCAIGDNSITITGHDVNHIKNVLRLKCGEQIIISRRGASDIDEDYYCSIKSIETDCVIADIDWTEKSRELDNKIYLFQGLPKSDKMELIIQKAVELGAYEIIPVQMQRSVVKLDAKKGEAKRLRWQAISESAAKQSKRSIIPQVHGVMTLTDALMYIRQEKIDICLLPYENEHGIAGARGIINEIGPDSSVAVLIGPEGGFDKQEIDAAVSSGFATVSLGKRILRTETAGLMLLSVLMFNLEK